MPSKLLLEGQQYKARLDKTLEDGDLLYTGVLALPGDFWERHGKTVESWQQGGSTFYRISGPLVPSLMVNPDLMTVDSRSVRAARREVRVKMRVKMVS